MLSFFRPAHPGPVFVCPMDQAGALAARLKAGLVISISDPENRATTRQRLGRLRARICELDFHDIERPAPDMAVADQTHIEAALADLRKIRASKPVLVHCHAGISRSSALALIAATARLLQAGTSPDTAIDQAFNQVGAATPHARPNMHIIALGEAVLDLRATSFTDRAWDLHRGPA